MLDCLVIGGGVTGMLTALHLYQGGLRNITLVERGVIGHESSWAGGGILSPLYPWRFHEPVTDLARWSQRHYPDFFNRIYQKTDLNPEYTQNGMLVLDMEESPHAQTWALQHQVHLETLAEQHLRDCEPELGDFNQALWLPDLGQVRNPRLLKALRRMLELAGIHLLESTEIKGIVHRNGSVLGAETQPIGMISAEKIVIAAGAWSKYLLASIDTELAVEPVRGQMILFKTQPGLISRLVLGNDRYVIPRRDGHVLVGSTVENVGFDKSTTDVALENLKYAAFNLIPRLTDYPVIRQWAGLRPSSPQGIPYISEHPTIQNLYLNTGHFRNGIVLGLASAQLLADIVLQRPPILDPTPYVLQVLQ